MLETRQYSPISFKPSKCNHVPYIRNKCWMARWNNKILRMGCCWLTIIESPSSILPSFFSSHFLSLILSLYPHFQALPGRKDWQRDDGRSDEGNRAGQDWVHLKNTPCGNIYMPWSAENRPNAGEPSQPIAWCPSLSHSCSGAQRRWHTNGWSSPARRNSSMHTVSSKGHETVNQRIRDGNATSPLVWGNSKMSRKDVIRSLRNAICQRLFLLVLKHLFVSYLFNS